MSAAPFNATLATKVTDKDLQKEKKHLEHVAKELDKAPHTVNGGVHLGPGAHADFPANLTKAMSDSANLRTGAHQQLQQSQMHSSGLAAAATNTKLVSGPTSVLLVDNTKVAQQQLHSAPHSGEVQVQSNVVIDTVTETRPQAAAQIQSLLSRLSTTTQQIDDYSRRQNEAISAEANKRIQEVIARTQAEEDALLRDAASRAQLIEGEYSQKLKVFLQELDASKASNLAALERDLNFRQETLLSGARDSMDDIHQRATQQKMGVMQMANAKAIGDVDSLTAQVKQLGEAEVERRMASTTTTVITTQTTTSPEAVVPLADKERMVASSTVVKTEQVRVGEPRA